MIRALWLYRGFILGSVKREFSVRYLGSTLGSLWSVIHPLVLILIYTLIFSELMQARLPGITDKLAYGIYLCAGVLPWTFFTEIITRSQTCFVENANLLKKASLPRICFPAILVGSAVLNFLVIFGVFLVFLIATGRFTGAVVLDCVPLLVIQTVLAIGIGIFTGTLNVFIRDVGQIVSVVLQFWFWLTPIVYPVRILPAAVRDLLYINPMLPIIEGYQGIFVRGEAPAWSTLTPVIALAAVALACAYLVFRKNAAELVDQL